MLGVLMCLLVIAIILGMPWIVVGIDWLGGWCLDIKDQMHNLRRRWRYPATHRSSPMTWPYEDDRRAE